jgi:hypothetical protein
MKFPFLGISKKRKSTPSNISGCCSVTEMDYMTSQSQYSIILARCQWLTPVILQIWEAEMGRITVRSQPRQTVHENFPPPFQNNQSKMDWRCGPRSRAPEALSSNPSPIKKKKKKERKKKILQVSCVFIFWFF